jgi:hypothetical protein
MHAHDLKEPKEDTIWTNTSSKPRIHEKSDKIQGCPNYIKETNQHMIDPKDQQVN